MERIYFDHSATTPTNKEVASVMYDYMSNNFGNPSSVHFFGREARRDVTVARETIAKLIGADANELFFMGCGTEGDNLALKGIAYANRKKGNHIITSSVEHHAVLHVCEFLEKEGFEVTYLPVDEFGMVNPQDVEKAITDKTILISIMFANNEVGTIQPIKEIGEIAKAKSIYFHTDAVQAAGNYPIDVKDLNVDLLTLSGHKFNGPKGIGALYVRKGVKIAAVQQGGAQERNLRAGTENVPSIIGLAKAAEVAMANMDKKIAHETYLRDKLIKGIQEKIGYIKLNGHPTKRMPNNVNFSFRFVEGEALLLSLDLKGIAASSGSACTSGSLDPSHVLLAMGMSHEVAHGSLRLSLGHTNTEEEVDYCLEVLPQIIERLRMMSPLSPENMAIEKENCETCSKY